MRMQVQMNTKNWWSWQSTSPAYSFCKSYKEKNNAMLMRAHTKLPEFLEIKKIIYNMEFLSNQWMSFGCVS